MIMLRKVIFFMLCTILINGCTTERKPSNHNLEVPKPFSSFIKEIKIGKLRSYKPKIDMELKDSNLLKVNLSFNITEPLQQDDWQIIITPSFMPNFHWSPHLTPTDQHVIPQHVFRAPALVASDTTTYKSLVIMPDVALIKKDGPKWYMDMDALTNKLTLGFGDHKVKEHVLFVKESGATFEPSTYLFSFYIKVNKDQKNFKNPWRDILSFYWKKYGNDLYEKGEPIQGDLETYVEHTYNWAFNTWKNTVWQEFELNGKIVGAPTFIVNVTQSPNYKGRVHERELRSIWNQAWFSSLRSASGLYRYARRTNNKELLKKALMTKELALAFPKNEGFFPGLIATETENVEINGQLYPRSKGWDTYYFGNSNRNPYIEIHNTRGTDNLYWGSPKESPYHILDMSWTAYLMLMWYDELEKDKRLLDYALDYADALLQKQDDKGYFPGWISLETLQPLGVLDQSPESAMSVTFLLKAYELTGKEKYKKAALKCMDVLINEIIYEGRWEDFETYWSCSGYGKNSLINKKIARNNIYKQNNFSMYWTAEALFNAFQLTKEDKYLKIGQRTLDELLMTQASWQPPYMFVKTLGGFGVMNGDAEWNDSRQSLFAELIIKYGRELGDKEEYIKRGLAALRSSFVMMYCPENPQTREQWEARHPHFGPEDYGFMMENYGHDGTTGSEGVGIGVFTIYDWGNGAASEAYNRILDHYGADFINNIGCPRLH